MFKTKAFIAVFLCLCLSMSVISVYAQESEAVPYNVAIIDTGLNFNISQTGFASCYGDVSVQAGYTVQLVIQLQQKGSMWKTVKSWTDTSTGIVVLDETYQVEKGHEYRLMNVYIAYDSDGNKVESFYDLSPIVESVVFHSIGCDISHPMLSSKTTTKEEKNEKQTYLNHSYCNYAYYSNCRNGKRHDFFRACNKTY